MAKYDIAIARPDSAMNEDWRVVIHDAQGFSSQWNSDKFHLIMQDMAKMGWDFKGQVEDNGEKVLIWQRVAQE